MIFYEVEEDVDIKGPYPQSEEFGTDTLIPEGMVSLSELTSHRKKEPFIAPIILKNRATLTDYISTGYLTSRSGVQVHSRRMYDIYSKYVLPPHEVREIPLLQKKKIINGYLLVYTHEMMFYPEYDFNRLVFKHFADSRKTRATTHIEDLTFESVKKAMHFFSELNDRSEDEYHYWEIDEVYLKPTNQLDWFLTIGPDMSFPGIITERLMEDLVRNNITGLTFKKVDWIKVHND